MEKQESLNKCWQLYVSANPEEKLRQGDLIFFDDRKNTINCFGIVVTADCDLDQNKHGRLITLVPLLDPMAIAESFIYPEKLCGLAQGGKQLEVYVRKKYSIPAEESISSATTKALLEIELDLLNKEEASSLSMALIRVLEATIGSLEYIKTDEYNDIYSLLLKQNRPSDGNIIKSINDKGDLFVLPQENVVYGKTKIPRVAWVRNIWQEPLKNITLKNSEIEKKSHQGQRIARLLSPFSYRLTQKMSHVFSDIGLPNYTKIIESDLMKTQE